MLIRNVLICELEFSNFSEGVHNLPDSPFTSPHKPYSPHSDNLMITSNDTSINGAPMEVVPPGFDLPSSFGDTLDSSSRICKGN